MNQVFYAKHILPHHIKHIKWLEAKKKHKFWFQEDNDPSHGTRSENNVAAPCFILLNHRISIPLSPFGRSLSSVFVVDHGKQLRSSRRQFSANGVALHSPKLEKGYQRCAGDASN
jgi:hypothetical protein